VSLMNCRIRGGVDRGARLTLHPSDGSYCRA
jgi:hypothetical protein